MTAALSVDDLTVRFGGILAVEGVSMTAEVGSTTGLIGPNGAGKTTIFNVCTGLQRPTAGRVWLFGADVTDESTQARARRGLGRTFQRVEVCERLTVRENVSIGAEGPIAGGHPIRQLIGSRAERRQVDAATSEALSLAGIEHLADRPVAQLSTGQRRLVELSRVIAGPSRLLLLDEPSSGLDGRETEAFGSVLQRVVADRGVGILLVEHDMTLVMGICERIWVLDFGLMVFVGTPQEVAASPDVRAAYLGSEEVGT